MKTKPFTAFLLKRQEYKETGAILSFFSLEEGFFTALAQGVKKEKNKWRNAFEPFAKLNIECIIPRSPEGMKKVIRAEKIDSYFEEFSTDRFNFYSFVAELCLIFCPPHHKMEKIFKLLEESFSSLIEAKNMSNFPVIFSIKFMTILGFFPHFTNCTKCHQKFSEKKKIFWDNSVSCASCASVGNPLSFTEIKILAFFQRARLADSMKVRAETKRLFSLVKKEISLHTDRKIKTLEFLE